MTPTSTAPKSGFTTEAFEQFLTTRDREPDWLRELRRQAWQAFCELDLPSRREEKWMRTDIRLFHLEDFDLPQFQFQ